MRTDGEDFDLADGHTVVVQRKLDDEIAELQLAFADVGALQSDCATRLHSARVLRAQRVRPEAGWVAGRCAVSQTHDEVTRSQPCTDTPPRARRDTRKRQTPYDTYGVAQVGGVAQW